MHRTTSRSSFLPAAAFAGLGVIVSTPAQAQSSGPTPVPGTPYTVSSRTETWSGCPAPLNNLTTGDGGGIKRSYDVSLPFSFRFYDTLETQIAIDASGAIAFASGVDLPSANDALGLPAAPNGFIAALWDDLELVTGRSSSLDWSVSGTAPNRELCVQWVNVNEELSDSGFFDFKIVLHENGQFDVHYGPLDGSSSTLDATIGMEDQTGGRSFDFTTATCSPTCTQTDYQSLVNRKLTFSNDLGPELYAGGIEVPQFATLGAQSSVFVTVGSNHGNFIRDFDVRVVAGTSPTGANAIEVGRTRLTLAPFEVLRAPVVITPPASLGEVRVYLGLEVDPDDQVDEVFEDNNVRISSETVRLLPSRPDIAIRRVGLSTQSVSAGEPLDVYVTATNAGSETLGSVDLDIMLSTNPVISPNDDSLGSTTLTLATGETVTTTVSVVIGQQVTSGLFYIGALGDRANTLDEVSETNNGLAAPDPIEVTGSSVALLTTQLPQAVLLEPYTALLTGVGGSGVYAWEVVGGVLPPGLGLTGDTGELFGRPNAAGCESFRVRVSDVQSPSATDETDLQLCVVDPAEPLTVVTRDLPRAILGQEYAARLVATGGESAASLTWSGASALSGIEVTPEGFVVGSPREEGTFDVMVEASDGRDIATRILALEVSANANLQIVTRPLPAARLGEPYSHRFESTGGIEPITWIQVDFDDIGLDLDPSGLLSGVPERAGRFRIEVLARDAGPPSAAQRDADTFELVVEDDGALQIVTESLPTGNVGVGYERSISAIGGLPEYTWTWDGSLPEGLVIAENPSTNELRIGGTPQEEAETNLLVTATDRSGRSATRAFLLAIGPEVVVVEADDDDGGCSATRTDGHGPTASILLFALFGLTLALRRRR